MRLLIEEEGLHKLKVGLQRTNEEAIASWTR